MISWIFWACSSLSAVNSRCLYSYLSSTTVTNKHKLESRSSVVRHSCELSDIQECVFRSCIQWCVEKLSEMARFLLLWGVVWGGVNALTWVMGKIFACWKWFSCSWFIPCSRPWKERGRAAATSTYISLPSSERTGHAWRLRLNFMPLESSWSWFLQCLCTVSYTHLTLPTKRIV